MAEGAGVLRGSDATGDSTEGFVLKYRCLAGNISTGDPELMLWASFS